MNRQFKKISFWSALGLLLFAAVVFFLLRSQPPAETISKIETSASGFLNLAKEVEYVGDDECAVCHSEIYRSFKQNGMGRSFYRPTPANVIEDYAKNNEVYDARAGLRYKMYQRDSAFFQLEFRLDQNGQLVHGLGRKVDYIIGSGNHNRSYVTSENGFLLEMPVTWYSEKKIWDLSPGYHSRNLRFSRPIVPECMNCHNSYAEHVKDSENRYQTPLPMGIGCERCHGPGALHVTKRYAMRAGAAKRDTIDNSIVNPKHLPFDLQMDVCRQCHLQGDMSVFKEGRRETDFRPGMQLRDVKAVFIRDRVATGDFRIASHGARISLSACFIKSAGRLVCTTCHNPHESVKARPRTFFNAQCLSCHALAALSPATPAADHRAAGDCVACHMRQGATSDILHVNFTDHWIRKEIQALSKSQTDSMLASDNAAPIFLKDFFDEKDASAPIQLGIAYVKYFEARHGDSEYIARAVPLLEAGLSRAPDYASGRFYLGVAYRYQRRFQDALAQFQQLLALSPNHAAAYFQSGEIWQQLGKLEEAAGAFESALQIFTDDAKAQNNLGNVYAAQGKTDKAIAAYQRALQIQPSYAPAYNNLGDLFVYRLNDLTAGRQCFEKALRLDPNFTTAMLNLGNVDLALGRENEALALFQQIIEIDPRFTAAYGNLAAIYQRRGRREEAIRHLRKVLELDPQDGRARNMLRQLGALN
jgi:tetratricopeptide (TPR) repeat protein